MKSYKPEITLLILILIVSLGGFWHLFLGENASPKHHHFLHLITSLVWLSLLLFQLVFIVQKKFAYHRKVGLLIFIVAPITVATVAMLSVHSAARAITTGQPDMLIVQNVAVTIELAMVILLSFVFLKNRLLHGNLLMSSSILFLGIALFFSMIGFVPQLQIQGPETFYRFGIASNTSLIICTLIGILFFFKNWRIGWPWLLVPGFFHLNNFINIKLNEFNKIDVLTQWVGSQSELYTFLTTLILFALLLFLAWRLNKRTGSFKINSLTKKSSK